MKITLLNESRVFSMYIFTKIFLNCQKRLTNNRDYILTRFYFLLWQLDNREAQKAVFAAITIHSVTLLALWRQRLNFYNNLFIHLATFFVIFFSFVLPFLKLSRGFFFIISSLISLSKNFA